MMIFADGENLVFRYQAMLNSGWEPRNEGVTYLKDVLIWHQNFSQAVGLHEIIRATYYTYIVGDDVKVKSVQEKIKSLTFGKHGKSQLPSSLTPQVFKKAKSSAKSKGVDIQMTVDILNHVHSNNVDTVVFLSGDGDYFPLIKEVQRCGKQCYVGAFSDGLNEQLRHVADKFYYLDKAVFSTEPPK